MRRRKRNKIESYYPAEGVLGRTAYDKHIAFFAAGATHSERLFLAANRVGKTTVGAYETACHLTGRYPDWWPGRRFTKATAGHICNTTNLKVRDINQLELLGPLGQWGTGMIPADLIADTRKKSGVAEALGIVFVKHISGDLSQGVFKSYEEGRDGFQGEKPDFCWDDEEPPGVVNEEQSRGIMATTPGKQGGIKYITFTPLNGYTDVVKSYLESDDPDKMYVQMGWKDAPHLTEDEIGRMSKKFTPSQLKARSEGFPAMGEGSIYPFDVDELTVDDFVIPKFWWHFAAIDFGHTAIVWFAWDRQTDIMYIYREYYSEQYNAVLHADAIRRMGDWIPLVGDPAGVAANVVDGRSILGTFYELGINITPANNAVEDGISQCYMRMASGRLLFFRSCTRLRNEYTRYHRIKVETVFGVQSKIVKKADHFMDAMRYGVMSGPAIAALKPEPVEFETYNGHRTWAS